MIKQIGHPSMVSTVNQLLRYYTAQVSTCHGFWVAVGEERGGGGGGGGGGRGGGGGGSV